MRSKKKKASSFGVIGLGRFGTALAITLAEAGREVIVVDKNEEKVKAMRQYTEYAFVTDNLSKETLTEIGMKNCDTIINCIGEKIDTSILTTLSVVSLGVPHVIAKATSPEQGAVLEKRLVSSNVLDFIFLDNQMEIQQVMVGENMVGHSVQEYNIRKKYGLNIIAIEQGDSTEIEIAPDYRFAPQDIIVVIGKIENIRRFEQDME